MSTELSGHLSPLHVWKRHFWAVVALGTIISGIVSVATAVFEGGKGTRHTIGSLR